MARDAVRLVGFAPRCLTAEDAHLSALGDAGKPLRNPRDMRLTDAEGLPNDVECLAIRAEAAYVCDLLIGQLGLPVRHPSRDGVPLTCRHLTTLLSIRSIRSLRTQIQVIGSDALLYVAVVAYQSIRGNRTVHHLPGEAVNSAHAQFPATESHYAVTATVHGALPQPTSVRLRHLRPETCGDRTAGLFRAHATILPWHVGEFYLTSSVACN